jgi:polyhydroxyalkanoate synthesis regulator phasin
MTTNPTFKKLLDAGVAFTQMTQARAEELVRDFVKLGDLRADEVQANVQELVDQSRKSAEQLVTLVSAEVARQLQAMGFSADKMSSSPKAAAEAAMDFADDAVRNVSRSVRRTARTAKSTARTVAKAAKSGPAPKPTTAKASPSSGGVGESRREEVDR